MVNDNKLQVAWIQGYSGQDKKLLQIMLGRARTVLKQTDGYQAIDVHKRLAVEVIASEDVQSRFHAQAWGFHFIVGIIKNAAHERFRHGHETSAYAGRSLAGSACTC